MSIPTWRLVIAAMCLVVGSSASLADEPKAEKEWSDIVVLGQVVGDLHGIAPI